MATVAKGSKESSFVEYSKQKHRQDLEKATGPSASNRAQKWRAEFDSLVRKARRLKHDSPEFSAAMQRLRQLADCVNALREEFRENTLPRLLDRDTADQCEAIARELEMIDDTGFFIRFTPEWIAGRWMFDRVSVSCNPRSKSFEGCRADGVRAAVVQSLRQWSAELAKIAGALEGRGEARSRKTAKAR